MWQKGGKDPGEGWRWLAHRKAEPEGEEEMPWGRGEPWPPPVALPAQVKTQGKASCYRYGVLPVVTLFLWQTIPQAACF